MKAIKITTASVGLLLSTPLFAAEAPDVAANFGILFDVAGLVAFVIGFYMVATAIYSLYTWSKGNQGKSIGSVILNILVGTFLASIGWIYQLMKGSLIGDYEKGVNITDGGAFTLALDTAAAAAATSVHASGFGRFIPDSTIKTILAFVFLVGFVAFISGVYAIKDIGTQQGGQHPLLNPIVKIIGGVLCMNITWFGCFVSALLNIPALCSGG
ncbi:hypothetical protein [Pseudomonas serbica]|uniref:hypothetical protein n=1 Tax=Pseudomonas serbica TaxID=2965074 RepID=UPI00237C31DD|nr:hypothetical protein [Pseudomonas serbica]